MMLIYRQFSDGTSIYRTRLADGRYATWLTAGPIVRICELVDPSSHNMAYRWPDTPLPACRPGMVAFDEGLTDLSIEWIRERFPEHAELWDAVATERARVAAPQPISGLNGCAQGREFTDKERISAGIPSLA